MKNSLLIAFLWMVSLSVVKCLAAGDSITSITTVSDDELILDDDTLITPKSNPLVSDSFSTTSTTTLKEKDEDLILDGGEEDLLGSTKSDKTAGTGTATILKPSAENVVAPSSDTNLSDSLQQSADSSNQVALPTPSQLIKAVSAKPAQIQDMQSINFAQNLKGYRKPTIAMLLSFLLPGAGQVYCHSNLKAGIFASIEVAIIGIGAAVFSKGRKEQRVAFDFADQNYSDSSFNNYYEKVFKPSVSDTVLENLFSYVPVDSFLALVTKRDREYYNMIQGTDQPYIRGWRDVSPQFQNSSGFVIIDPGFSNYSADSAFLVYRTGTDSSKAVFGYSENQKKFSKMYSDANRIFDVSKGIFSSLVLNHIVSMIDAGISAKAYNTHLLGKESFWQRIHLREKYVKAGTQTIPGYALEINF